MRWGYWANSMKLMKFTSSPAFSHTVFWDHDCCWVLEAPLCKSHVVSCSALSCGVTYHSHPLQRFIRSSGNRISPPTSCCTNITSNSMERERVRFVNYTWGTLGRLNTLTPDYILSNAIIGQNPGWSDSKALLTAPCQRRRGKIQNKQAVRDRAAVSKNSDGKCSHGAADIGSRWRWWEMGP